MKIGNPFKRKVPVKVARRDGPNSSVVQPLVRETTRRAAPVSGLPRFQATASDQPSGRGGDRIAVMRAKLRYAFTPSQPVADRKMFAGREEELRTVIRSIEDQRLHVVLYGERGIGKTSLLHMLSQAASEARYIVIYTSCGANSNFDDTIRAAATDIPVLFHSSFAPTAEQSERGASLADLLPAGAVSPRQFADLCSKLTGTRVLLILDEFDRCESEDFRRDVAELIKNLSDRLGRVQLVLAGVAADLTQLVAHIPSIRRNIFAHRVGRMADEEIMKIVSNGEREVGFTFEPAASELVTAVSRGSPYIANLLAHHAGQSALGADRVTVLAADVAASVDQTCMEFEGRIGKGTRSRLRQMMSNGQDRLLDLAARTALSVDGAFNLADVQDANQVDAVVAKSVVDSLMREGMLAVVGEDEYGKRYDFPEEGLPLYIWISSAQHNLRPADAKARVARR